MRATRVYPAPSGQADDAKGDLVDRDLVDRGLVEVDVVQRFVSFDGIEIAFKDHRGDPARPPVVLHHGFAADTNSNWRRPKVLDALVATGRRVISIDARGHGQSDKPHDPAAYDSPAMAADVSALFDHLDLSRVDLVGYSMGGFVSLETATRDPRLRSLVLGGIGAGALPGQDRIGPPIPVDLVAGALEAEEPPTDNPAGAGFRMLADATGADRLALAAVVRANAHHVDSLAGVTCPTLVLAGDNDPLVEGVDRLVDALPNARFVGLVGDHLGVVGTPEFRDAIVGFLDELDATP